jgi:hypothetical protein
MTPSVTLRQALEDPALLGDVFGGATWMRSRLIFLVDAMGGLTREDQKYIAMTMKTMMTPC